jgi:hypothetical protein
MYNHKALLLNASNMESFPVYPYAFIQVPAVARRAGVEVVCKDLLGSPQSDWPETVQRLIEAHAPEMILITLRNVDSHVIEDYARREHQEGASRAYFPVERTKSLIEIIRKVSALKVVVGGFGFSIIPELLMQTLRPDYGVFGGGEAFFAHFDDLKQGVSEQAANLLYFQDGRLVCNPRTFFPPLGECEYNTQVIEDMLAFYVTFPTPGFEGAPVEILRGCPHTCLFCSEPHVLGAQVHYRPLDAVMADIEILVDHGITEMYMISPELNPQGSAYVLQLAERIRAFNSGQSEAGRVTWYGANYLLGFTAEEYEQLYASGFTGGWFDITALDDDNARAMRTPYRNARLVPDLKIHVCAKRNYLGLPPLKGEVQTAPVDSQDKVEQGDKNVKWTMFLGNPATTTATIRETLRIADLEGLPQMFNRCSINTNMRVFDYAEPDPDTLAVTYSINPDLERIAYQPLYPSFAYPPALFSVFDSDEDIEVMFAHLAETYLSTHYQETRDWLSFIQQKASRQSLKDWIKALSDRKNVNLKEPLVGSRASGCSGKWQSIFTPQSQEEQVESNERLAKLVVEGLLATSFEAFPGLLEHVGLPGTYEQLLTTTPYRLAVQVYTRWDTREQLFEVLDMLSSVQMNEPLQDCMRFCVEAILYRFNLQIKPEYRALFVEPSDD